MQRVNGHTLSRGGGGVHDVEESFTVVELNFVTLKLSPVS